MLIIESLKAKKKAAFQLRILKRFSTLTANTTPVETLRWSADRSLDLRVGRAGDGVPEMALGAYGGMPGVR